MGEKGGERRRFITAFYLLWVSLVPWPCADWSVKINSRDQMSGPGGLSVVIQTLWELMFGQVDTWIKIKTPLRLLLSKAPSCGGIAMVELLHCFLTVKNHCHPLFLPWIQKQTWHETWHENNRVLNLYLNLWLFWRLTCDNTWHRRVWFITCETAFYMWWACAGTCGGGWGGILGLQCEDSLLFSVTGL